MAETFSCPNCGGPLEYKSGMALTFPCPFCGSSVIVPEELRPNPADFRAALPEITSEPGKSPRSGWGYFLLVIVAPIGVILLIIFGLNAIFNPDRGATEVVSTVSTAPASISPTKVPQATPTPEFASLALRFGGEGTGAGKFQYANDIAVAPDGTIYVGDRDLYRIQAFDAAGKFITQVNLDPSKGYRFLAIDRSGSLFVNVAGRIYRYNLQTGEKVGEIEYQDQNGDTSNFGSLGVLPNGGLAAAWISESSDDILIFDAGGKLAARIENAVTGPADWGPEGNIQLAVDGLGNIYGLGTSAQTVVKYSPAGKFLTRFGSRGDKPGQFSFESHIAIDSQGLVYVFGNNDIIFDPDGLFLETFDLKGIIYGPTFDLNDSLFVSNGKEIMKYTLLRRQ